MPGGLVGKSTCSFSPLTGHVRCSDKQLAQTMTELIVALRAIVESYKSYSLSPCMYVCEIYLLVCRSIRRQQTLSYTIVQLACIQTDQRDIVSVCCILSWGFCIKPKIESTLKTISASLLKPELPDLDPDKTAATGEVFPFNRKPANALRRASGINNTHTLLPAGK